jgi:Protein of unknown function (DUF1194)
MCPHPSKPNSFVVAIRDRDRFKEAIRTKLVLEVAGGTPERRIVPVAEKSRGCSGVDSACRAIEPLAPAIRWRRAAPLWPSNTSVMRLVGKVTPASHCSTFAASRNISSV